LEPAFVTDLGVLYEGDCLGILPRLPSDSVDTIFADPPFNLGKKYGANVDDLRAEGEYFAWCCRWLDECVRILKPGGAIFVYNLPKWNFRLAGQLDSLGMKFRHWIPIKNNSRPRIKGRLYPSHYALLYFTKGEPRVFREIRTPLERCRHCKDLIKDYGGYRKKMNANGVNLTDIWTDIAPVRHKKYKPSGYKGNMLSTKIVDRVVEMSTRPDDLVLDPFGGSGTTYAVCERKGRRWVGMEIESTDVIIGRLSGRDVVCHHENLDHVDEGDDTGGDAAWGPRSRTARRAGRSRRGRSKSCG
jgi:site-specific DNA-methyltransferase (adenine-specific)